MSKDDDKDFDASGQEWPKHTGKKDCQCRDCTKERVLRRVLREDN